MNLTITTKHSNLVYFSLSSFFPLIHCYQKQEQHKNEHFCVHSPFSPYRETQIIGRLCSKSRWSQLKTSSRHPVDSGRGAWGIHSTVGQTFTMHSGRHGIKVSFSIYTEYIILPIIDSQINSWCLSRTCALQNAFRDGILPGTTQTNSLSYR